MPRAPRHTHCLILGTVTPLRPHLDADERFQQELDAAGPAPQPHAFGTPPAPAGPRFNVLLTQDREHPDEHWTRQVPRLLQPFGIHARVAGSTAEALDATRATRFHAVVVDLATPAGTPGSAGNTTSAGSGVPANLAPPASGLWLLEVLRRLDATPPTIVINAPMPPRQAQRLLNQALRLGAFAVINRPVQLNTLLSAIQRILERHHNNTWPPPTPGSSNPNS